MNEDHDRRSEHGCALTIQLANEWLKLGRRIRLAWQLRRCPIILCLSPPTTVVLVVQSIDLVSEKISVANKAGARFTPFEARGKVSKDALSTWPPARPNLYFDCGVGDRWLEANRHFHQHLDYIGYRHTYVEQPGYHTLPYWDRAIRQALPTIADAIGAGTRDR